MQTRQGANGWWLMLVAVLAAPGENAAGQQPREQLTLRAHEGAVTALAVSPDGRTLASGSFFDGTFRLWEVASGKERACMRGIPGDGGGFVALAFSPDGRTLALGREGGTVWIWDATGKRRPLLQLGVGVVRTLAFSVDGQMLAVGGFGLGRTQGGELRLWRTTPWREYLALRGLAVPVQCLAFAPDGRMLAGGGAGSVRLWETATGKVRKSLPGHHRWGYAVAFLAQGRVLASATDDEKVRLWDVRTGKERLTLNGHSSYVYGLALAKGGKLLASAGDDRTVRLWDTDSGKQFLSLTFTNRVGDVVFTPDGKTLVTGDHDGMIKLWSVPKLLAQKGKR